VNYGSGVLVVLRFAVAEGEEAGFLPAAHEALDALAQRPGYRDGTLGRAYDDPGVWCLVTTWESVGAYRRALSAYDVKMRGTPLLARALPEPSAFEPLAEARPGGPVTTGTSDRAEIPSPP
jgi:heme oxygenase (mycobilin-producing)